MLILPECRLCIDFISRRIINMLRVLRRGKTELMSITHSVGEISDNKGNCIFKSSALNNL